MIEIRPLYGDDLVQRSKDRAKKYVGDLKKMGWLLGDDLYEEGSSLR